MRKRIPCTLTTKWWRWTTKIRSWRWPKRGNWTTEAGDDEELNAVFEANGEDSWATPVEEPPKSIGEPNGVVLPNGLRAKGLLLELFCPKHDWEPKGLHDACLKAVERIIIPIYQWLVKVTKKKLTSSSAFIHTHTHTHT